jgi:hypothetical protein
MCSYSRAAIDAALYRRYWYYTHKPEPHRGPTGRLRICDRGRYAESDATTAMATHIAISTFAIGHKALTLGMAARTPSYSRNP